MTITDKQIAAYLRDVADVCDKHGRDQEARVKRNTADYLDPPKPTYPDGTVAWVWIGGVGPGCLMIKEFDGWVGHRGTGACDDVEVVEVIPTVPEGHVTLPGDLTDLAEIREAAAEMKRVGGGRWPGIPLALLLYAQAIEDAKATERGAS